ncbi:MAG: hypothetical protein ACLRWF_09200 [Ruthenibacterium sp.]
MEDTPPLGGEAETDGQTGKTAPAAPHPRHRAKEYRMTARAERGGENGACAPARPAARYSRLAAQQDAGPRPIRAG